MLAVPSTLRHSDAIGAYGMLQRRAEAVYMIMREVELGAIGEIPARFMFMGMR